MKRLVLILICLVMAALVGATDKTPYPFELGGNGYSGSMYNGKWTHKWIIERYDGCIAGGYTLLNNLYDSAAYYGKPSFCNDIGPYTAPQEIGLYDAGLITYAARMLDTVDQHQYIYSKRYMDSVGISAESLVVHIADDSVALHMSKETPNKSFRLDTLAYAKKRMTHQYWNNPSSGEDPFFIGYLWLLNGRNADAIKATNYWALRYMIQDSARVNFGPGGGHWTAMFFDNYQYFTSVIGDYWDATASYGGPSSGIDFYELHNADDADSARAWKRSSWDHAAAEIQRTLDPYDVTIWLNAPAPQWSGAATNLGQMIDSAGGMSFEAMVDISKNSGTWDALYALMDICKAHPATRNSWTGWCDWSWSSDPGSWLYDSSRFSLVMFAAWLQGRDTNSVFCPLRYFNDTTRWFPFFEKNFGEFSGNYSIVSTQHAAEYTNKDYVVKRSYDSGDVWIYVRTSGSTSAFTTDSVSVALGGTYYLMDEETADFGSSGITSIYLKPWQAKIVANEAAWDGPHHSQPYGYGADTLPYISRTPSTFTFTATAGGGNPANQTLNISNSGAGTLDWALTDNAAWLSLGTPSGENTGSSTVIVDISGLSAGVYNATITITDVDATNNPQTSTVSLTVNAAESNPGNKRMFKKIRR